MGWKDEWADEKRFSEIVRVDNISKITNGVVHGLVEKLSKSPFFKKRKMSVLKARPCSSDCPPIRHESAIKEKTRKSSHSELHKREALTQRSWGSGGLCEPPSSPGMSPGGGQVGENFAYFPLKMP